MSERIDYNKVTPEGYRAMSGLDQYVRESGLEPSLLELVKLRASQINGCAYCIDDCALPSTTSSAIRRPTAGACCTP